MRSLLIAGLVLVTAACGAYQFPGASPSPPAGSARVSGTVLAVPCSPVEPADKSCPGRMVPNLEIDYLQGSNVVAKAVTNSSGAYVIDLAPGRYDVALQTYMRVVSGPTRLSLAEGTRTVADYVLDTGIRAPVPQQ
jgi:hypothetical protein